MSEINSFSINAVKISPPPEEVLTEISKIGQLDSTWVGVHPFVRSVFGIPTTIISGQIVYRLPDLIDASYQLHNQNDHRHQAGVYQDNVLDYKYYLSYKTVRVPRLVYFDLILMSEQCR